MWLTNFPYVFAIPASLEGQVLLPLKLRKTSLRGREGASGKEWLTKNPLGCTPAWRTRAGLTLIAIVELQGGALLTLSFGKKYKLCWQTENKLRRVALRRRELSTRAEQSTWVPNLTQGKLKAVSWCWSALALDLARGKCQLLVSMWRCVCEGRREETIL